MGKARKTISEVRSNSLNVSSAFERISDCGRVWDILCRCSTDRIRTSEELEMQSVIVKSWPCLFWRERPRTESSRCSAVKLYIHMYIVFDIEILTIRSRL